MASNGKGAEIVRKFNKLYLMPDRKTRLQTSMDVVFGRKEVLRRVPRDYYWQIAERKPRREDMSEKQDWPSVWPAAQSYRAASVPLPLKMSYKRFKLADRQMPLGTYGNLELVKIPNFLHLTPHHVHRHCEAIKKFCTPFPEELKDPEVVERYRPLRIIYSTYVHQGTDIRDARAREVTAQLHLSSMRLKDTHAHNKCRQLVGDRYDESTDVISIESKRCPLRQQNTDYLNFLITALYHESHRVEEWEKTQVQELLELKERARLEEEGEPESPEQAALMMKAAAK